MKNFLSKIKIMFEDNPISFITPFAAIFLALLIILFSFIPSSAADEPSESDQVIIPAGTYNLFSSPSLLFGNNVFYISFKSNNYDCTAIQIVDVVENGISYRHISYQYDNSFRRVYDPDIGWTDDSFRNLIFDSDQSSSPALKNWLLSNSNLPEPTPTYTIQPNYYQIKLQPDMIPDDIGFYEYGGQFIYEGETYRSLRFARVSSLLTNVYLYDDDGNQIVIKGHTASNDGWFSGRNITLVSPITTENEDSYSYFTENLSATEQSPFDLVTYMISAFFKALDNFYIFFDFTLLDFIFVMCGLLSAVWFLKLLAGG